MEPYKFEEDIKKKLEKRTIKPTANSWNKLADSLEFKGRKKGISILYLMGIAASIVGVLFIVSIFLKKDADKITPTIVNIPIPEKEEASSNIAVEKTAPETETLTNTKATDNTLNSLGNSSKETISKTTKPSNKVFVDIKTQKLQNTATVAIINTIKNSPNTTLEAQKIEELITQIEDLKTQHITITDNDIDALLKDAQLTLALEKLYVENTKTVDAYKLLQDVEADLDKSIRVKFLETLKLNYENMKTAIAQRND
jgi:hypothetical protein